MHKHYLLSVGVQVLLSPIGEKEGDASSCVCVDDISAQYVCSTLLPTERTIGGHLYVAVGGGIGGVTMLSRSKTKAPALTYERTKEETDNVTIENTYVHRYIFVHFKWMLDLLHLKYYY